MSDRASLWRLEGVVNGEPLRTELADGTYVVGRSAGASLQIPHTSVSREHAVLTVEGARCEVRDSGSRNGTFVNEHRLAPDSPSRLRSGDSLRFGVAQLTLVGSSLTAPSGTGPMSSPSLSTAEQLQTSARISWDDLARVRGDLNRDLFQLLSEAGKLLVEERPLAELFEQALILVQKVAPPARRVLIMLDREAGRPGDASADLSPPSDDEDITARLDVLAALPRTATTARIMLSRSLIGTVMRDRAALLVLDAQNDPRFRDQLSIVAQDVHSALAAPLFDNERVIGIVYADTNDLLRAFDEDQLRAITFLANLIAIKITNTRLMEGEREKRRMALELQTAARIQESLLPTELPTVPGYEIHARQFACYECAGDLYDAANAEDGTLALTLGDVSGKGMGAAMLMSHVMACLRIMHDAEVPPLRLVERLHQRVVQASRVEDFVTLFHARLDPREHRLEYVNAGHNSPYILSKNGQERPLEATGAPVGMPFKIKFEKRATQFEPGDLLCIFSDGIPEARVGDDDFGDERILQSLRAHHGESLPEIADALLDEVRSFLGGTPAGDDITLLLLRRSG